MDIHARRRPVLGLLLDILQVIASSLQSRMSQRERAPTHRALDLTQEDPDANADIPGLRPESDSPSARTPDPLDLTDEPNDTRNELNLEVTFFGGGAKMSINGIRTPLYAAAAVFVLSLPTVFPIIVTPGHTGPIPTVVTVGWLGLSVLVVLLTFLAP